MYLPNPSLEAGCDTRTISKQSNAGLNLQFSFSNTDCLTKAKESSFLNIYPEVRRGQINSCLSQKHWHKVKNQRGFEIRSLIPFPPVITIILSVPLPTIATGDD